MSKIVMGYWDCPYCDTKGVRGDQAVCPSCGRPRGQVRFYMKGQAQNQARRADDTADIEYIDEETARHVNRNPDWYCSFCETLNSDNADTCRSCGASRSDSEANYFQMRAKLDAARATATPATGRRSSKSFLLILAVLALAIVGLFTYLNGNTTSGDYLLSGVSWERHIQVEQHILYHESGWSVPAGGTITGQRSEVHHYDNVVDHYENVEVQRSRRVIDHYETTYTYNDLGNGLFEQVPHENPVYKTEYYTDTERRPVYKQVARYQTRYDYDIMRWTPTRTASASGTDQQPYWPDPQLANDEREGDRAEAYRIRVTNTRDNSVTTYRMAESDWRQLTPGDPLWITAKRNNSDIHISDESGNPLMPLIKE